MADAKRKPVLVRVKNGVVTPLYFDRQVVRAEDLTLDRTSRDQELERMRRLLHGWGVVAGLIPLITEGTLTVTAGYGITKTGAEIYLREAVAVENILGRVWRSCGPGEPGCKVVDEAEIRALAAAADTTEVISWLVARPVSSTSDPRPGVAEGCAHPANVLRPTRACDEVSLELLCKLPPSCAGPPPECETISPYLCAETRQMLPMPPIPAPDENILVLGRIIAGPENVRFDPTDRRAVLPVSVLQDWMQACLCPLLGGPPAPPPEPDEPATGTDDRGGEDVRPSDPGIPGVVVWDDFLGILEGNGISVRAPRRPPDFEDGGSPPDPLPRGPEILTQPETMVVLSENRIAGPIAFLETDSGELAVMLGRPVAEINALKVDLEGFRPLLDGTPL